MREIWLPEDLHVTRAVRLGARRFNRVEDL
jgi:hypothetical protein